jgi:hypothetical protein
VLSVARFAGRYIWIDCPDAQEWCIPVIKVVMTIKNGYLSVLIDDRAKRTTDSKNIPMTRGSFKD